MKRALSLLEIKDSSLNKKNPPSLKLWRAKKERETRLRLNFGEASPPYIYTSARQETFSC
ncbi:hypothetical protein KAS79_01130 [Candidatus Parcubacteria bacterium]|nr:hypothetical protein [Candidatus Parcubacteria bacterium]